MAMHINQTPQTRRPRIPKYNLLVSSSILPVPMSGHCGMQEKKKWATLTSQTGGRAGRPRGRLGQIGYGCLQCLLQLHPHPGLLPSPPSRSIVRSSNPFTAATLALPIFSFFSLSSPSLSPLPQITTCTGKLCRNVVRKKCPNTEKA